MGQKVGGGGRAGRWVGEQDAGGPRPKQGQAQAKGQGRGTR